MSRAFTAFALFASAALVVACNKDDGAAPAGQSHAHEHVHAHKHADGVEHAHGHSHTHTDTAGKHDDTALAALPHDHPSTQK
jgi:hypothetical protein